MSVSRHNVQCSSFLLQGDVHGCPYKTLDKDSLRAALQRLRVDPAIVEETVTKAKVRPEQASCPWRSLARSGLESVPGCRDHISLPIAGPALQLRG